MKKRISEKVKQEIVKSEGIIAAIGDGISIQDTDYIIVYQNKIHKKIFGNRVGEKCYEAYQLRDQICDGCPVAHPKFTRQPSASNIIECPSGK